MSARPTLPCLCACELIYATIVLAGNSVVSFMALGSGFFQISFWTAHGSAIGSRLRIVSKIPSRMSINLRASQFLPLLESSRKCGVMRSCKVDFVRDHVNCRDNLCGLRRFLMLLRLMND